MTQGLRSFFNLPELDEVLKDKGIDVHPPVPETVEDEAEKTMKALQELTKRMAMMEGADHGESMDEMHQEILKHARDLMDYGFNIEQTKAARIFEMASLMYGHAINAKNLKRDAQLKAMKLALDKRKVDLDEKRTNHIIGQNQTVVDGSIVVEDRNEIIKRLRDEMKNKD